MKISGFTIIRNAVLNDYPVVEAIRSILPIVDEMIVSIGDSEDETERLIRSVESDKIRIVHSVWDPAHFTGGHVLAVETDKALQHISPDSDWAFYIQADEVVHEQYHRQILEAAERHLADERVQGLLFRYLHFYGTYDYVGDSRKWYRREIRMVRPVPGLQSYKDAQGFRIRGRKLRVKLIDASIYHYGWVKSPRQMRSKYLHFSEFWQESLHEKEKLRAQEVFDFNEFDSLVRFDGTHPAVMQERIDRINWQVALDVTRKKFSVKDRFLYFIEKHTGIRLFEYRNYRILR